MKKSSLPPNVEAYDKVILFDGVCKLCHIWSNFIIKHDHQHIFKLCSVQSVEGQKILQHFGLSTDRYETMLLVEAERCFQKSEAFLNVVARLSYPWKVLIIFKFIPGKIRDYLYDRIALNRYRLFGKYDHCLLPSPDHQRRFINKSKT